VNQEYLQIHPNDNVLVALKDLPKGVTINWNGSQFALRETIRGKHKFTIQALPEGHPIRMYGVLVGKAVSPIEQGAAITTQNVVHASDEFWT
jgi:altronate hydrolase